MSWMRWKPYSRASSTSRARNGSSMHSVVGLEGKFTMSALGLGHAGDEAFELGEELVLIVDGDADDVRPGNHGSVNMDGIAGVGDDHGIARVEDGETEVGDTLLGPDGDDGLRLGVKFDVITRLVPGADGFAQARQPARDGVAVRGGLLRRFDHLVYDVLRGGAIGIAHAEVDNVFTTATRGHLHLAGDVEDIGREALDTAEFFHGDSSVQGSVISDRWSGMQRAF